MDREIPIFEAANKKSLTPVVTLRHKLRSEVILVQLWGRNAADKLTVYQSRWRQPI
jgi:hypothetical protein